MKKITFNTLPEAISELIVRIDKIERILSKKAERKEEKTSATKRTNKRQETPAGLLSIKEAGKLLKMSVINLYSYVKNKKIPFEKRGRRLFFSKSALENWMKTRNQQIPADYITIKEAEKLLKVSATTIYYKIRSRKLKPAARRGNKLYYSKKDLISAFTKPATRGKKATKPAKAKAAKTTKASKAKAGKAKAKPAAKPGRPAKKAATAKSTKQVTPKAEKPAVAKAEKTAMAKAENPAKAKKAVTKAAKKAKQVAKPKATKPKAVKAKKQVKPAPVPVPETAPAPPNEKAPEPPFTPANNEPTES